MPFSSADLFNQTILISKSSWTTASALEKKSISRSWTRGKKIRKRNEKNIRIDGLCINFITRNSKTKPLVLPSVFQKFPDMEGILKLSSYDYCKVKVPYVSYPALNEYLEIRKDMLLESLIKKVDIYKKTVEDSDKVVLGADEHINKPDKPSGQLNISL